MHSGPDVGYMIIMFRAFGGHASGFYGRAVHFAVNPCRASGLSGHRQHCGANPSPIASNSAHFETYMVLIWGI
jgi:hypothetical protein